MEFCECLLLHQCIVYVLKPKGNSTMLLAMTMTSTQCLFLCARKSFCMARERSSILLFDSSVGWLAWQNYDNPIVVVVVQKCPYIYVIYNSTRFHAQITQLDAFLSLSLFVSFLFSKRWQFLSLYLVARWYSTNIKIKFIGLSKWANSYFIAFVLHPANILSAVCARCAHALARSFTLLFLSLIRSSICLFVYLLCIGSLCVVSIHTK